MLSSALFVGMISSTMASHPTVPDLTIYKCSLCETIIDKMIENDVSFPEACDTMFDKFDKICDEFHNFLPNGIDINLNAHETCFNAGFCPGDEGFYPPIDTSKLDIRVAKAHAGTHGYDKVRVTVISNETMSDALFSYSAPFKYRWTNMHLNTGIATVTPGTNTPLMIGGKEFNILIPEEDAGIRGMIVGDPCFSSLYVSCQYANQWNMFNNTVALMDAASARPDDISYWMMLGDNFYDQKGEATQSFFSALSYEAKLKLFGTTPGNHDFWVHSSPKVWVPKDQLGHGFMQV